MQYTQTRRRFLAVAGIGSVGLSGCLNASEHDEKSSRGPSTLIATWRGTDPTRSVDLQWLEDAGNGADPITVEVVSESEDHYTGDTDVVSFGDSDLSRHRAELTDLEPDTLYRITIAESETGLTVQTAPEEITKSLTFAEGGDVGISAKVPPLHEQAASWDPLFGFIGGDIAYADGYDVDKWVTFLEQWNEYMRSGGRLIPLVAAIGDHELRDREFDGAPEDAPFFYSLFDNTHREQAYWPFDIGDKFSLLILDSDHTTRIEGPQTEWLEDALTERTDRDHLLIAYHVPAYPSAKSVGDEQREEIRDDWTPLFEEYDVDAVFEHDNHAYKRTHPLQDGEADSENGILYLGDGAWGREPRDVYSPKERSYLAVSKSELHVIRTDLAPDGSQRFRAVNSDSEIIDQSERTGTHRRDILPARTGGTPLTEEISGEPVRF